MADNEKIHYNSINRSQSITGSGTLMEGGFARTQTVTGQNKSFWRWTGRNVSKVHCRRTDKMKMEQQAPSHQQCPSHRKLRCRRRAGIEGDARERSPGQENEARIELSWETIQSSVYMTLSSCTRPALLYECYKKNNWTKTEIIYILSYVLLNMQSCIEYFVNLVINVRMSKNIKFSIFQFLCQSFFSR